MKPALNRLLLGGTALGWSGLALAAALAVVTPAAAGTITLESPDQSVEVKLYAGRASRVRFPAPVMQFLEPPAVQILFEEGSTEMTFRPVEDDFEGNLFVDLIGGHSINVEIKAARRADDATRMDRVVLGEGWKGSRAKAREAMPGRFDPGSGAADRSGRPVHDDVALTARVWAGAEEIPGYTVVDMKRELFKSQVEYDIHLLEVWEGPVWVLGVYEYENKTDDVVPLDALVWQSLCPGGFVDLDAPQLAPRPASEAEEAVGAHRIYATVTCRVPEARGVAGGIPTSPAAKAAGGAS